MSARRPQMRVRRGQDDLEARQVLGRQIEPAIGSEVGLDALEDAEIRARLVEPIDLRVLPLDRVHRHAAGN